MEGHPHKFFDLFVQLDKHTGTFVIVPPRPPWVEEKEDIYHFGAGSMNQGSGHKNNGGKVLADGQMVLSREHCVDGAIPHINLPPPLSPNLELTAIYWFSKNKCIFGASKVLCPDGPITVAVFRVLGINAACNDPCIWLSSLAFASGTVLVGFTLGDILAALLLFLLEAAIDWLASFMTDVALFLVLMAVGALIIYILINVFVGPAAWAGFIDELVSLLGGVVAGWILSFLIKQAIGWAIKPILRLVLKPLVKEGVLELVEWLFGKPSGTSFQDLSQGIDDTIDRILGKATPLPVAP